MHAIEAFLGRPEVERLGWVLLHFLWQGTIGAAFLAIVLFVLRRASANARYLAACTTLVAMAACLPATWLVVPQRSAPARSAMAAMEPANSQPMVVAHETITAHDSGTVVGAPDKPLDESFAKGRHQQPSEINSQAALAAAPGITWQQRIAAGLPWFAAIWLGGVMALSLRLAIGWSAVRRLRRAASQPADDSRQAVLSRLSRQLGIRWSVKLLESALVEVPTMIGWLRPAILWPPSVLAGLSVEQFESLLAHELAHVRRHDYLVNLAQTAIETLLFYHPAVWWVSNRIRQERECCCDDLAVATCGNRISYARALTVLEELRPRPRQFALAADGGRLLARIRRIVGLPAPRRSGSRHWLLGIALSGTALALIVALELSNLATGDEPAKKSADHPPASAATKPANSAEPPKSHTSSSQPMPSPSTNNAPPEQPKSRIASPRLPCDLEVRRILDSDATELLPQSLGDRIKKLPHVTAVWGWLGIDSPPGYGVPLDSPLMKEPKIIAGRMLAAGDRHKVIVGKLAAEKRSLKVGDTMKVYGTDVEIVGIFEHPRVFWNIGTIALLPDLQELMHAERQVSEFLVTVDIPEDGAPDQQAQFAELCKQIVAVGYDLIATSVAPPTATSVARPPPPDPLAQISPSTAGVADENTRPEQRIIQLSGRVVDDETGKLVPAFHRQIGDIFADQVNWRHENWSEPPEPPGYFSVPLGWTSGDRLRIVAGGYIPELVLTERPKPDATEIKGITVRMRRGRQVSGRVVDYQGNPVAGASVFAVGALRDVQITGGKALVEAPIEEPDRWIEDQASVRFTTDGEGRFTATGVGWDARYLAVSCPALDLWIVPAPLPSQPQTDFEIRLPQPGKLVVHYDIAGAADSTEVALWPWKAKQYHAGATRSLSGPATLEIHRDNYRSDVLYGPKAVVTQRGEVVFDNLPPTDYVVERIKRFEDLRRAPIAAMDQSIVKILPGKTTIVDFVRPKGSSVTGQVVGLDRPEVLKTIPSQVFVSVGRANETEGWQPPKYDLLNSTFDVVAVGSLDKNGNGPDGKFTTERLPPGQYRITARVFDEERSNLSTLEKGPLFAGDTLVTVPDDGEPPRVKIELHKFKKPTPKPEIKPADPSRPIPESPYKIKTLDCLSINVVGTLPGKPIAASYTVESGGDVDLGPSYGRVKVEGLTLEEAAEAIYRKANVVLEAPQVSVTLAASGAQPPVKTELQKFEKPVPDHAVDPAKQGVESPAKAPRNPNLLTHIISGHAVDAETGQPVQGFVYDEATFDERDPARFHWNGDAIGPGSQRDGEFGIVVKNQPGRPIWARIVAPGYVPQPITDKPIVLGDDAALDKLVVKMHRGKELAGRVVDSAGKPVADAGVYLLRNQGRRQVVRDPAVAGPNQQFEMLAITHAATDADGRFKVTGWDAESGRVAVLSGEMNLWVTAIPADPADWTIHLPHPATIECLVDNDRGERDTLYDLDFVTAGRKGWEMLRAYQFNLRSKDGRLVIANHTPGQYQLTRRRHVAVGDYEGEFRLADVKLQIDAKYTHKIDLRRSLGSTEINGQIVELKELGLSGAVISVEPPGPVKRGAMSFDALTCGENGQFITGPIPIGKYRVHVDAYLPKQPRDQRIFGSGLDLPLSARLPDFTSDAEVTIIEDKQPEKLKLELKKGGESRAFRELMQYHEQPHPAAVDEFTAPPWTVAAPNEHHAANRESNERPDASTDKTSGRRGFDLGVQKSSKSAETGFFLPEEFGDRIKKLPHVSAVTGGLLDSTGIDHALNASVVLIGLPPDSLVLENWEFGSGHFPKNGDRHKVVVGKALAGEFTWRVGDSIMLYGGIVEISGIYESTNVHENDCIAMPLLEMQEAMNLPRQVAAFAVRTDIPRSRSPEQAVQMVELRKAIAALGDGIVVLASPDEWPTVKHAVDEQQPKESPEKPKPAEAPMPESKPIDVRGQVIDDATGKPITLFDQQGGHVDPKDATKIAWGYYLRPNAGGAEGRFDANIDWNAGWRARIIASGYLPQPILAQPPKAGQTKIEGLVLRMKRGREVSGRVLDHAGKPVKDASLFIVGSRPVEITGSKALMNSSHGLAEDSSAVRYSTDADGRFTLAGIGEDAKNIAVSCPTVDLWIVPAPSLDEAAKGFEIRLPEPGKLIVHYDIPGGAEEATLLLQLHTWDREGWKGVDNRRRPTVKQHGELVLDNMPPGLYEVVRDSGGFLDRRQVTIEPGKTVTTDFIRKTGAPITGRVVGLDREDVQKAKPTAISVSVYKPGDERNPLAPKFASVGIDPFDKEGKPSDGSFKTERIPPGEYLVRASVFIKERPERGYRTGTIPPGFEGEATVTVPEQGAPPPVEIQLKKWGYKAPENPQPKKDAVDKSKQDAVDAAVKRGIEFLARQQAERDAAAKAVPNEVTITIDPALAAELRALDAMRAGASTNFEKVNEAGEKLFDRFHEPDERGQIYYALLQVHGQSGLVTPEHIIEYAKKALDYRLGSRQELMVYIYWGDTLNVRKTEKPWREQRIEAAEIYLRGLRRLWQYNVPEQPPELPDPPPVYNGDDGTERDVAVAAMKHYMELKNRSDFIRELIYHRQIFIRQIADMYHRRGATPAEIEVLRRLASDMLANESAIARLMAAVEDDPKKPAEQPKVEKRAEPQAKRVVLEKIETHANDKDVIKRLEDVLGNDGSWSKPVNGLEARLSFGRGHEFKGAPVIFTFLELRNVGGKTDALTIPLNPSRIEFKVTDAAGKEVAIKSLIDGVDTYFPKLELPDASQLRWYLRGTISDDMTFKDPVTILSIALGSGCIFPRGDTGEYMLHAKFTIPEAEASPPNVSVKPPYPRSASRGIDVGDWHGTIEVPPVRIPLTK